MPTSIRPVRVNHLNSVMENFDEGVAQLQEMHDADFLVDLPNATFHACLVEVGRMIIETFVPGEWLLASKYGPHWLGIEYQADMDQVRAAVADHGMRIVRDIGLALHTHPDDGFGVAFEFYSGSFHDNTWETRGGDTMRSVEFWRDEHPLALTGLKAWTLAVHDLDAGARFIESFLSGERVYEVDRPAAGARAVGLQVADSLVEVLAPTGEGPVSAYLRRYGHGIYSAVLGTRDIGAVRDWYAGKGVSLVAGTADGALMIPGAANLGMAFEFSE